MTKSDIERYRRQALGVNTDGDRDRFGDRLVRYAPANIDQKLIEPTSFLEPPFMPPGFLAGDTTTVAAPASGDANAIYLGQS